MNQDSHIIVHKFVNSRTDENTVFYTTMCHADQGRDFCLLNVKGLQSVPVTVRRYNTIRVGEKVYALVLRPGTPPWYSALVLRPGTPPWYSALVLPMDTSYRFRVGFVFSNAGQNNREND